MEIHAVAVELFEFSGLTDQTGNRSALWRLLAIVSKMAVPATSRKMEKTNI